MSLGPTDRPLPFSQLAAVQMGLSLAEIYERLGPPTRHYAGSPQVLAYRLQDGSRAEILYAHPQLMKIVHYRRSGGRVSWVPASRVLPK